MNNARPVKPSSVRTFLVMLICTAFLVVAWEAATAQPLTFQWARQSTGHAEANSMAADSSGNAYVAGGFAEATVSFGGITLTNLGNGDAFVAKYDVSGHVLWVRQGGVIAGGQASILDIALDVAGNAYAVGYFRGDLNFGGSNINSGDINGDYDGFVAKFSAGGSLLWMRQIGGANSDLSSEVAVDGVGNAYVAGSSMACVHSTRRTSRASETPTPSLRNTTQKAPWCG